MLEIIKNKLYNKETKKYVILIITIIVGVIVIILKSVSGINKGIIINENSLLQMIEKEKIGIYIDGEVNSKGYIQIPKGATLEYAIDKAGGITKDANIQGIDIGRILKNQEKIIIPKINVNIEEIEGKEELININTASIEKLSELDGIGAKTAENIIKYREKNKFDNIEEIMEVKGIGESKYTKIKEKICT